MSEQSPGPAVLLRDVRKDYDGGAVQALRGVDLQVLPGEWVAVTGPSGCGKSTLLHLLAALELPTSGQVLVQGRDLATLHDRAAYRRGTVGLVFQLHNLLPHLSAVQNLEVAMLGQVRRAARHERAMRLLSDVDLAGLEQRRPTRMSGGERQRVAIARALVNEPSLLLADEPTGSLDSRSVGMVIELVQRLRLERPELTVLMVTHDARVAAAADRVLEMADGRIVGSEPQAQLSRAGRQR